MAAFEVPDVILDALAERLAARLADLLADVGGMQGASPWMTFEEAVEYTRIPAGTFRKLSAAGSIPAHGGKRKLYHRDELDAALRGNVPSSAGTSNVTPFRKAS